MEQMQINRELKTANGIYRDIYYSDYAVKESHFEFFFSSPRYMDKFKIKSVKVKEISGHPSIVDNIYNLILYTEIEKRGMKIRYLNKIYQDIDRLKTQYEANVRTTLHY